MNQPPPLPPVHRAWSPGRWVSDNDSIDPQRPEYQTTKRAVEATTAILWSHLWKMCNATKSKKG